MVKKHMERCSTLSVTREMQIRTTLRNYYIKLAKIERSHNTKYWREWEAVEQIGRSSLENRC